MGANASTLSRSSDAARSARATHYRELDGMRGVLALTVVLYHLGLNTVLRSLSSGVLRDGVWGLCVDFFFVLSGFVLARSFVNARTSLEQYAIKRYLRLAPMFLLTLALTLAIEGHSRWSSGTIVLNALMLQSLVLVESVNFPSWSIPFELLVPAAGLWLAPWGRRRQTATLAVTAAGLVGAQALILLALAQGRDVPWLRAAAGLPLGGVLYLLRDRIGVTASSPWPPAIGVTGSLAVMAVCGVVPAATLIFPLTVAGAIWFGAEADGLFSTRPAQALGRWSYSIYLLHIPVLLLAERLLGTHGVEGAPTKGLLALLIVGAAAATWKHIEVPCLQLGYRKAAASTTPLTPATFS